MQVEEELEEEDETDEQYLRKVADIMHSLFGTHGSTLLPFFDELLPTFAAMLVSELELQFYSLIISCFS